MSTTGRSVFRTLNLLLAAGAAACAEPGTAPTIAQKISAASRSELGAPVLTPVASLDWQQSARDLAGANKLSPLAAARVYAALSVAEYGAVMATEDADLEDWPSGDDVRSTRAALGGRSAHEARRGAVAGASAQVLSFFFPTAVTSFEQLIQTEGADGAGNVHPAFTRGVAIGRVTGDAMVERTKNDNFTAPFTGTIPVGPGLWIANGAPAGATLSGVTPYLLSSADQFRPPPPPPFGSPEYTTALQEIRTLSDTRTAEQLSIALEWNYATGTFTPPGYWDLATANYIRAYGLDERAATHAFAMTNAAMMDSFIGCFDAKYHYLMIRPPQADANIKLVFALPNHPSYPSAHSCASAAAATVLSYLFPDRTDEVMGWVTEAGLSRMYAGIHYRFDIDAGQILGTNVGRLAIARDGDRRLLAALR
jgi:membrane-associated phospholipid phosphatase